MGWKFWGKQKEDVVEIPPEPKKFLDELPPKFKENEIQPSPKPPTKADFSSAWARISWDDFRPSNLVKIPCFRDAGLTGLATMGVFGSVIFIFYKNPSKAVNWSFGGLWLGSVIGWEQCNSLRRTSMKTTQIAKQVYEQKSKKKEE